MKHNANLILIKSGIIKNVLSIKQSPCFETPTLWKTISYIEGNIFTARLGDKLFLMENLWTAKEDFSHNTRSEEN